MMYSKVHIVAVCLLLVQTVLQSAHGVRLRPASPRRIHKVDAPGFYLTISGRDVYTNSDTIIQKYLNGTASDILPDENIPREYHYIPTSGNQVYTNYGNKVYTNYGTPGDTYYGTTSARLSDMLAHVAVSDILANVRKSDTLVDEEITKLLDQLPMEQTLKVAKELTTFLFDKWVDFPKFASQLLEQCPDLKISELLDKITTWLSSPPEKNAQLEAMRQTIKTKKLNAEEEKKLLKEVEEKFDEIQLRLRAKEMEKLHQQLTEFGLASMTKIMDAAPAMLDKTFPELAKFVLEHRGLFLKINNRLHELQEGGQNEKFRNAWVKILYKLKKICDDI